MRVVQQYKAHGVKSALGSRLHSHDASLCTVQSTKSGHAETSISDAITVYGLRDKFLKHHPRNPSLAGSRRFTLKRPLHRLFILAFLATFAYPNVTGISYSGLGDNVSGFHR